MYNWIIRNSVIIGLIIDAVALIVSIVLTVVVYKLERKHNQMHEELEKAANKKAIEESAKVFLIDNEDELDYLPLAVVAASMGLKRKHNRLIITKFLRCGESLQREICKQSNISDHQITMDLVLAALGKLQQEMDNHNFGKSILYDGGKYLHRALERWPLETIDSINPYIFENLRKTEYHNTQSGINCRVVQDSDTLFGYMWEYLHISSYEQRDKAIMPPIDMLFYKCDLGTCSESTMTFWTMRAVIDACYALFEDGLNPIIDESIITTQEEMYYYTIAVLCTSCKNKESR